jgi:hypothetical protein
LLISVPLQAVMMIIISIGVDFLVCSSNAFQPVVDD